MYLVITTGAATGCYWPRPLLLLKFIDCRSIQLRAGGQGLNPDGASRLVRLVYSLVPITKAILFLLHTGLLFLHCPNSSQLFFFVSIRASTREPCIHSKI